MKYNIYKQKNYEEYLYKGFIGVLFKFQHKLLSPKIYKNCKKVLEIGPHYDPHIKYAKLNFTEYHCLDLDKGLDIDNYFKEKFPKINFKYYNGSQIDFPDNYFDRVIISHTLEHIVNPENFLNELIRVVKKNGIVSIASPCDNGLLWRLGRFVMKKTYLRKKTQQIDHDYFMANEHVNTIFQIRAIITKKFKIKSELFLPFGIRICDLNLFHICHIIK